MTHADNLLVVPDRFGDDDGVLAGGWTESVLARAAIGAVLGVAIGAALGAVSRRSPGRRAVLLAVALGLLLGGVAPELTARLGDRWRTPRGTAFGKYQEEIRRILRVSPIIQRWAARRGSTGDAAAEVTRLAANGMRRLPDHRVVRLAILSGRMLGGIADEECARLAEGTGSPRDRERLFATLDDQQVAEVAEGYVAALEAEIADDPRAIVPSEGSVEAAMNALAAVDAAGVQSFVAPAMAPGAPPAAKCRMRRYLYGKLEAIPEEHRATLARAVGLPVSRQAP